MQAAKAAFNISLEENKNNDYFYYGNITTSTTSNGDHLIIYNNGGSGGLVESSLRKALNIISDFDDNNKEKLKLLYELSILAHIPSLAADIYYAIGMQHYSKIRPFIVRLLNDDDVNNKTYTLQEKEMIIKAKTQFELSNNYTLYSNDKKMNYHINSCIELGFIEYYVYKDEDKSKEYFNIVDNSGVATFDPVVRKKIKRTHRCARIGVQDRVRAFCVVKVPMFIPLSGEATIV